MTISNVLRLGASPADVLLTLIGTSWPTAAYSRNHEFLEGVSRYHRTEHSQSRAAHGRPRRSDLRTPPGSSVRSIIVRAVTRDHADGLEYHALPIDDPVRALNILRESAGLQPLSDEHDDQGGSSVSR